MADVLEFETGPNKVLHHYRVTSNAICFRVKTSPNAIVGLSPKPEEDCLYRIILETDQCVFKDNDSVLKRVGSRNLISENRFKEFWLTWRNKKLVFGQKSKVLLSKDVPQLDVEKLTYVSFFVGSDGTTAKWQFFLPPEIENAPLKPLESGELRWIAMDSLDQVPADVVIGGFEREFLYIIRANHRDSVTPGKFVPSLKTGIIGCNGIAHHYQDVEILCGHNCWWEPCKDDKIPAGAVFAGKSDNGYEHLYVGRVRHMAHLIVGKILPSHGVCYFAFEEEELFDGTYEVLVAPSDRRQINVQTPNPPKPRRSHRRRILPAHYRPWEVS